MRTTRSHRPSLAALLAALLMLIVGSALAASPARAAYEVDVRDASPSQTDDAMAFSDFSLVVGFPRDSTPKSVRVDLPKGQLGALDNATTCSPTQWKGDACPNSSRIGFTSVDVSAKSAVTFGAPISLTAEGGMYRLPATGNEVGRFGLTVASSLSETMYIEGVFNLRGDGTYGITADVPSIPNRAKVKFGFLPLGDADISVKQMSLSMYGRVYGDPKGFFFNPAECIPATTQVSSVAWDATAASGSASYTPTNCAAAPFAPTVAFGPASSAAATPTAFSVDVTQPYSATAAKIAAPFREVTTTLPPGVQLTGSTNSDGALVACTDAQFGAAAPSVPSTCPAGAKIGTVALASPLIGTIPGDVFLAQPAAPVGADDLIRLFIVAQLGPAADQVRIKMGASVSVDPTTGLLTTTLLDLPAQPVTSFRLSFRAGTAPAVRQPRTCGTFTGSASLTSYATPTPAARTGTYTVDTTCTTAGRFRPTIGMSTSPTRAGATTTGTTTIALPVGDEALTGVTASLPPGLLANLVGAPRCSLAQVAAASCPSATKVGTVRSLAGQSTVPGTFDGDVFLTDAPAPDAIVGLFIKVPVQVGPIMVDDLEIQAKIRLRPDYGIDVVSTVPDAVRGLQLDQQQLRLVFDKSGFMTNPPVCTGNAISGAFGSAQGTTATNGSAMTVTGCAAMAFAPTIAFTAAPASATGASALTTTVTLPAGEQSPPKAIAVTLPDGVSLSASANATGTLAGCSDAQFTRTTFADPTCPAGSAIGTASIQTPSVGRLSGTAYLGTAVAGHTARLLIDAKSDAFGGAARVKLEGVVDVDPATGRTTVAFDGLPPVPFTSFSLTMRGGASPVLAMPRTCGSFAGTAVLTPHSGTAPVTRSASLVIDAGCPTAGRFAPRVDFALSPDGAGASGHLTTTVTVPAGDEELASVKLDLPTGLTAKLKGAVRCTIAQAQADACPAASQLGTAAADVGVAGAPFTENGGRVYLTDGRAGRVAGMAIVLPAKVGPIDLGKIVTIADVQLRSPDLALQITADVPRSVQGVRLDLRALRIAITKDDFLVNPSRCGMLPGTATLISAAGTRASAGGTITVAAGTCAAQHFDPQLAFAASNPRPGQASDFTTTVTLPDGPGPESPLASVAVRLPAGMSLSPSAGARGDLAGCTDAQFRQDDLAAASTCPAGSEIGVVRLATELVGDLAGKAYLAPATAGNLARVFLETTATDVPNLTVRLVGEVRVDPATGATDAVFADVPAIPVTAFSVTFRGGDAPTLALPRLCGTAQGSGTFVPASGGATQTRPAGLTLAAACPDPAAWSPSLRVDRSTQAAGRSMTLTTTVDVPAGQQELSSLRLALPAGLLGTISAIPACSRPAAEAGTCSAESRVGSVSATVGLASAPFTVSGAAYLVKGDADSIARLAITLPARVGPIDLGTVVTLADLRLRGDYGIDVVASTVPTTVAGVRLDLRRLVLAVDRPGFMVNPVACGAAPSRATLGARQGGSATTEQSLTTTNCDALQLSAALGHTAAPASPGVASTVNTRITASAGPGEALDAMRGVLVTMPEGLSLSPSAGARGDLAECTPEAFAAADIGVDAACPAGSAVGTVTIASPMVGTLAGEAYLGQKTDGHFAGIYLQAKAAEYPSLRVKITGTLDVDGASGRLTATFTDLPQVQVSSIDLTLRGGDAPVVALPRTCGSFGSGVLIQRHGGASTSAAGALVLDQDCPDPSAFAPTLELSQSTTQAGADTALVTRVRVPARQAELRSLDLAMPAGLLGRLTVAPKCALEAARAGDCGPASAIGSVQAKVGVATAPFTVDGTVYLTDGFGGSIAGLMFALPARVGPIDLGTVVTLAQLKITGNDLRLGITAADIPTRVAGIPLSIGELGITIDRPGMVINPTACGDRAATASFGSAEGLGASTDAGLRATGCEALRWAPELGVDFTGSAGDLRIKGHPTLTTVIGQTEGQGNLRSAVVTLPEGIGADLVNVNKRQCASIAQAVAGTCPVTSTVGSAEIRTSALPEPVDASIVLVDLPNESLPGLAIHVRDQIAFDLVGVTKLDRAGRVVANFDGLPDTPISRMRLVFDGGSGGIMQLIREACTTGVHTDGTLTAQHGAQRTFRLPVTCNGDEAATASSLGDGRAVATASFKPSGSSSALTFAVSNPDGIARVVLTLPKGAVFKKGASKLVKPTLTGAKAKVVVTNGQRRLAITIRPTKAGEKVTKVKFSLPKRAIHINVKIRKVLENRKTSRKARTRLLTRLMKPTVTMVDAAGETGTVKTTTKVAAG